LSPQYLGYRVPLRIRCGLGHEFTATPEAIDQPAYRGPRFCPECGGTRRKEDAELRAAIESCGYEFLAVESRLLGERTRRYVKVRCPAAHEYDVLWDNFAPKNGKPKKGCASCHHATVGANKRGDISKWVAEHGIGPTEPYKNGTTNCEWKCGHGHTFVSKFVILKQKKTPCSECGLDKFAGANGLERITPWTRQSGPTAPLTWKCLTCNSTFVASVMALGRKAYICDTCLKTPNRHN
jgi:hypothetical protein